VTNLGADCAQGADPVPGPAKRRQMPFRPYSDRVIFQPRNRYSCTFGLSERNEMRCLRAAPPAYRLADFMSSFSTLGTVN
jgi:hypothetical protein